MFLLRHKAGFTLVEMLVILALISVAVAMVYPNMFSAWERFEERLADARERQEDRKDQFLLFIQDRHGNTP